MEVKFFFLPPYTFKKKIYENLSALKTPSPIIHRLVNSSGMQLGMIFSGKQQRPSSILTLHGAHFSSLEMNFLLTMNRMECELLRNGNDPTFWEREFGPICDWSHWVSQCLYLVQLPHCFSQQTRREGVSAGTGMQPIYLAGMGSSPFFTIAGLRTESTVMLLYAQNKGREI